MKKILSVLMCFMVMFGVCVVGTACDPNKETEVEYKARIRKELDEIPVEANGYKLIGVEQYSESINVKGYSIEVNEKVYRIQGDVNAEKNYTESYFVYCNNEIVGNFNINYKNEFEKFMEVQTFTYYDGNFFIIRSHYDVNMYATYYNLFFPPTLFLYDITQNKLFYVGYCEQWFEYTLPDNRCYYCKIVKI